MRKGGSNSKGGTFEREICKMLSLWWTHQERDDVFWRTAGSGGRATNRARKGASTSGAYGDLTFTDVIGKPLLDVCCMELKRGYKPDVLDLVDKRKNSKPCVLAQFWNQASLSAEQADVPHPVVIFKRDQKQICIMCSAWFLRSLGSVLGPHRGQKIQAFIDNQKVIIMLLEDWLDYVTPESIYQLEKQQ